MGKDISREPLAGHPLWAVINRYQLGARAPVDRYDDPFTGGHAVEQGAGVVAQLARSDFSHATIVAQRWPVTGCCRCQATETLNRSALWLVRRAGRDCRIQPAVLQASGPAKGVVFGFLRRLLGVRLRDDSALGGCTATSSRPALPHRPAGWWPGQHGSARPGRLS